MAAKIDFINTMVEVVKRCFDKLPFCSYGFNCIFVL
jgi:hypothetical protein